MSSVDKLLAEHTPPPKHGGRVSAKDRHILWEFDSFEQFVRQAETGEPWPTGKRSSREEDDGSWHGTKTFEEALEFARNGWPEGLEKISHAYADAITHLKKEVKPSITTDVAGFAPSVPDFLSGTPEHMMTIKEEPKPRKTATIVTSGNSSSYVDGREMINYGAAVLSIIRRLTLAGYSTRLLGHAKTYDGAAFRDGVTVQVLYTIKDHGASCDFDQMAFIFINPAVYRRFWFALIEGCHHQDYYKDFRCGYGTPQAGVVGDVGEPHTYLKGPNNYDCSTPQSALASVGADFEQQFNAILDGKKQ